MKRGLGLLLLILIGHPASAEFTQAEKAEILRLRSIGDDALLVAVYAASEVWSGADRAVDPYALAVARAAQDLHREQYHALSNLVGSLSLAIHGNSPLSETLRPDHRVARAKFYHARIHPYRTQQVRAALDAAVAAGATTMGLRTLAYQALARIEASHAVVNLDLGFVGREPPWWPFLVRRTVDEKGAPITDPAKQIGVHGHFELSTARISQGKGYVLDALMFATQAMQRWVGEVPFDARLGLRNYTLTTRLLLQRVEDAQLSTFGIGSAPDQFSRLFDASEDALIGGGLGLRGAQRFGLRRILTEALAGGKTATANRLDQAIDGLADGWGLAVDAWTWDAIRFPCIDGFDSRGCRDGRPPEPLYP